MTMKIHIGPHEVAAGLFEALKSVPELMAGARMSPAMLVHEGAARAALLDWAEGRADGFTHLPSDVRSLAAAFIADFLLKLSAGHPDFAGETWVVPAGLSAAQQAKSAVAQELRMQTGPAPATH
jgi:hypothetical protein